MKETQTDRDRDKNTDTERKRENVPQTCHENMGERQQKRKTRDDLSRHVHKRWMVPIE